VGAPWSPGRSTATNMLVYMETLTKLMAEGHAVYVLYLDFAKAFDKVPHERLLMKCRGMGLDGKLLEWIRVWPSDRKQRHLSGRMCSLEFPRDLS
jgi:hypothetical protein